MINGSAYIQTNIMDTFQLVAAVAVKAIVILEEISKDLFEDYPTSDMVNHYSFRYYILSQVCHNKVLYKKQQKFQKVFISGRVFDKTLCSSWL